MASHSDPSAPLASDLSNIVRRIWPPVLLCLALVPIGHTLALAVVAGAVAVVGAVRGALKKKDGDRAAMQRASSSVMTYGVLCLLALAMTVASGKLARSRANGIVAAVERYKVEHGRYPERLDDLVPHYVAVIPRAGHGFFGEFSYHRDDDGGAWLRYITLPPFEGPMYRFDRGKWSDDP